MKDRRRMTKDHHQFTVVYCRLQEGGHKICDNFYKDCRKCDAAKREETSS